MAYPTDSANVTQMMSTETGYYELNLSILGDLGEQNNQDENDYRNYTLAVFYILMFVFSLCTNCLVLVVIYLFEKLTTVTNLLLLNLVLSSLLFIISVPFVAVYDLLDHWPFGDSMCKVVGSLYYLGFYSSVLFLALLTFDRHLAVVYSLSAQQVRRRAYALVSCAVVWILSALACIKPMILQETFTNTKTQHTYCQESPKGQDAVLRNVGFYTQLILFFLFPLLIVIYCYTRIACTVLSSHILTKFKTMRLIFVILLLFFICWTPFNVVLLLYERASTPEERNNLIDVLGVTHKFAYLYFCISPIFYTFVGKKFQNYFRMLLVKRFPGLKKHLSVSQVSQTNMSTKSTPNALCSTNI